MQLFHHTGLWQAISIIKSARFIPFSTSALNGDSGLNCYDSRPGYRHNQHEADEVILVFEWMGAPPQRGGNSLPYPPGVLFDMHPWRMFVSAPLHDRKVLRVSHLRFKSAEARNHFFGRNDGRRWPRQIRMFSGARRRRLEILKELRAVYRSNNCWVSIH